MKGKLCCIFNYAPHYRFPIFKKMGEELNVDFYFGSKINGGNIEKLDYTKLKGFKKELKSHFLYRFEYTHGWYSLAFNREYKQFLITPNYFAFNQWLFLIICALLGKKVYCWTHGQKSKKVRTIHKVMGKFFYPFFAGTFLYGNRARNNMIERGENPNKLHVIYNSLDYDKSCSIRKNISIENPYHSHFCNNYPIIIFIGRLTSIKKLDEIILVQRKLNETGMDVNVAFIGDGPEMINLKSMLTADEEKRVWFVGALYEEKDIASYLYHADLCLSPGNVGLTAIHCLSYGLPLITNGDFDSQMPEFEAIEQGKTGDFFEYGNINDMAITTRRWLISKTNREQVRKDCYRIIDSNYNPNYQMQVLKKVLEYR